MYNRIKNLILQAAQDRSILLQALHEICAQYQLAHAAYHVLPQITQPPQLDDALLTYPASWVSKYIKHKYINIDPIIRCGRRSIVPIYWEDVDFRSRLERDFMEEAASYDIGPGGMTFPIHGLDGGSSLFNIIIANKYRSSKEISNSVILELQSLSLYFHAAFSALSTRERRPLKTLSPRELDCLRLARDDFMAKEIANILVISEASVRLYLSNARTKLECKSTCGAVAKALIWGLL